MQEYFIQVKDHAGKAFVVPMERFPFTIGRGGENDLVLAEPSVSKRHAFIRRQGDALAIVDDSSRNGVFVNKERERIPIGKPRVLNLNDTIRIGMNKLKLGVSVNPEIPAQSSGSETLTFVPSRQAWDPVEKIQSSLFEASARSPEGRRAPRWQGKVSDLLLAPTLAASYELVLEMVEEAVSFDRCFIILFEKGGEGRMTIVAMRVYRNKECEVFASRSLLDRVARSREAVLVTSDDSAVRLSDSFIRSGAAAAICVPLVAGGRVSGVIYLDRQSSSPSLSPDDIDAIGPLAGLIALKIENFRLVKEQVDAQMMARDLELAKSIQESLFPQDPVAIPGYAVEGFSSPCYQVGGDYFDFLPQEDSKLILAIGDVSGKGLSSAMYMAGVRSALRAHAEAGREVEALMSRLEEHIKATFRSDHFLTLFLGVLDPGSGVLKYANAGHPPPIVLREGSEPHELEVTDPALNITAWGTFSRHEHRLEPGELLLFYTDGLLEAENTGGEQFGRERLTACLARHRERDLGSIRRDILQATETFAGERGPGDDRTLILLRRERT
jgi:sigma-B regulation protein RsbU (phosphoserine phosphatase)